MKNDQERLTLADYASRSNSGSHAWDCPRCGCRDWRVTDSRYAEGGRVRRRTRHCRHCGYSIYTHEAPARPANNQPPDQREGTQDA